MLMPLLLQPNYKSDWTPDDWDAKPVKVATAGNIGNAALRFHKDSFVFFCSNHHLLIVNTAHVLIADDENTTFYEVCRTLHDAFIGVTL